MAGKRGLSPVSTETQTSEVLGDLKAQGIRNGANDNFDQKATQTGTEALQAYLQSGLIQVRSDPQVAARLNRILQNSEGATLTYKDDTGKVSLTVAGQAKVQEVFNTLKLTETFDKKHFADQQTAMIVTLIVAIVLTICTAGAGAAGIGMVMASGNALGAAMINAAIIGMASTMTGQLAGGASFDDAFQAGVKAGAISAVTAGIAYGAGEAVNSMNGVSPAGTGEAVNTVQSGSQTIEVGSKAANTANNVNNANQTVEAVEKLKGLDKLTNSIWWEKTALNAVGQGAFAEAQGGSFKDGFKGSMLGALSATGAQTVGDYTSNNALLNIGSHAVLGCAVASASKLDCGSGALGGAASASLARVIDSVLPAQETLDANGSVISEGMSKSTRDAIIAGGSIAGSAAIASASGKDMMTAANAAANEVTNNYLKHSEATKLSKLQDQSLAGKCDAACDQEIAQLKQEDARRNQELADCAGVSSASCDQARANVRSAAAEYIRVDQVKPASTYGREKAETLDLARDSMGGVSAKDVAAGYGKTIWDGAKTTASGLVTAGEALLGDEKAQQAVKDGAGAAWDVVMDPNNWPQLVGAMSPTEREKLAQAYETGDAKTIGEMMGVQVANFPITGGGVGTVGKVGKTVKIAEEAASVAEDAGKTARAAETAEKGARALAEPVYKTTKEAKVAAEVLGFKKINETVHDGQAVFKRGKDFITRDLDGHNGGAWKMADSVENLGSKETRSGTFDVNLNRIGD